MDPNIKLILDNMNSRFDELDRRFADRDLQFADHAAAVDSRFAALESSRSTGAEALERRVSDLEATRRDPAPAAMEERLASLEANYIDRDADYSQRIAELKAVRFVQISKERDARVAALESAMADLAAWRPDVEGLLDDVRIKVQKLGVKCNRVAFDSMSSQPGLLLSPTLLVAPVSAGIQSDRPSGHRVVSTTRDVGTGVVTTWSHVPANGMSSSPFLHPAFPPPVPPKVTVPTRPSPLPVPPVTNHPQSPTIPSHPKTVCPLTQRLVPPPAVFLSWLFPALMVTIHASGVL